jgi:hypothetical protein
MLVASYILAPSMLLLGLLLGVLLNLDTRLGLDIRGLIRLGTWPFTRRSTQPGYSAQARYSVSYSARYSGLIRLGTWPPPPPL